MISNYEFREKIFVFINKTGMSATRFGTKSMKDPSFVFRLVKGREVRERGKLRVLSFMENYEKGEKNA